MFPCKIVPLFLAVSLVGIAGANAQTANNDFKVSKVTPTLVDSPNFPGGSDKRTARGKKWLEVEAAFDWQPRLKDPKFLNEVTLTYYILLNNAQANPDGKPTLLTATVTHIDTPQERDMHSVMYVSPRSLEKLFGGAAPTTPQAALIDVGVTLSSQGQVVAEASWKSRSGAWWPQYAATEGVILQKKDTPFASLAWDYYEPTKPK